MAEDQKIIQLTEKTTISQAEASSLFLPCTINSLDRRVSLITLNPFFGEALGGTGILTLFEIIIEQTPRRARIYSTSGDISYQFNGTYVLVENNSVVAIPDVLKDYTLILNTAGELAAIDEDNFSYINNYNYIPIAFVPKIDVKMKVSITDTTPSYLYNKLQAVNNLGGNAAEFLEISKTNPSANEVININFDVDKLGLIKWSEIKSYTKTPTDTNTFATTIDYRPYIRVNDWLAYKQTFETWSPGDDVAAEYRAVTTSGLYNLICTKSGTTAAVTEPNWGTALFAEITDGTAKWMVLPLFDFGCVGAIGSNYIDIRGSALRTGGSYLTKVYFCNEFVESNCGDVDLTLDSFNSTTKTDVLKGSQYQPRRDFNGFLVHFGGWCQTADTGTDSYVNFHSGNGITTLSCASTGVVLAGAAYNSYSDSAQTILMGLNYFANTPLRIDTTNAGNKDTIGAVVHYKMLPYSLAKLLF